MEVAERQQPTWFLALFWESYVADPARNKLATGPPSAIRGATTTCQVIAYTSYIDRVSCEMRIEILGTRGNVPVWAPGYVRHAGVLVDGSILLDLGEAAYLRRKPRAIFVTHLHPDHAAFLRTRMTIDAPLFVPERMRQCSIAMTITKRQSVGRWRVMPVPTRHSHRVRSLGYIVETSRRRLFYSSDLISIHPRYYPRLGRLDLVVTDGSFVRAGGLVRIDQRTGRAYGHAGIPDLVELFSRFTRRIIVTHFGSWFYKDIHASVRRIASFGNGVRVIPARDGMIIDL